MKKNYFLLLLALASVVGKSSAQTVPCKTDEVYSQYKQRFPKIAEIEKIQEANIKAYVQAHPTSSLPGARTTSRTDTDIYYIPVVVHVMHDYGYTYNAASQWSSDVVADNSIYNLIAEMNRFYSLQNNNAGIINVYKKYIGKPNIQFYLATIDPNGNPTNGITHHRSYLTYGGDDNVKMDLWDPTDYYNIWTEAIVGQIVSNGVVLAYANFPSSAAVYPFNDGVICAAPYINDGTSTKSSTLDHETGHYFNLLHVWNSSGQDCGVACGDDQVDDTPPTKGHYSVCNNLYDTTCAFNYFKVYSDMNGNDSIVNYPDTVNVQNTMDYSTCTNMFTQGQVVRMHAALNSTVGGRMNLWDSLNLIRTGVGNYSKTTLQFTPIPRVDLKPNPEFSANPPGVKLAGRSASTYTAYNTSSTLALDYFVFPGQQVQLNNYSWNDTVTNVFWQFPSTASPSTSTSMTSVNVSFTDPGWADIKMTVTGNGSGDTTADFPHTVFVAAQNGTPGVGYFAEFSGADTAQWPMFNYYNNEFKWQLANVGYDDHSCVMYTGYDSRSGYIPTGTPRGDYDDLFSVPLDLSSDYYSGAASLNFYYSGASRSSNSNNITDSLFIYYSTNKGTTWLPFDTLAKSKLCNMGATSIPFVPTQPSDWKLYSKDIPAALRTNYTVFRFRYQPNTILQFNGTTYVPGLESGGNNFYMDRVTVSPYPAGVGDVKMGAQDVVVAPNPTTGNAYVIVKDANNTTADITVTDITGKVVYTTSSLISGNEARIVIPHAAIAVQGMYLVQTRTGNQVCTKKLIVE